MEMVEKKQWLPRVGEEGGMNEYSTRGVSGHETIRIF